MNTSPYDFDVVTGPSTPSEEPPKRRQPESGANAPHDAPNAESAQK